MCQRVQCSVCDRPTYAGCGKHVEQVLGDVPPADRCTCADEPREKRSPRTIRSFFRASS